MPPPHSPGYPLVEVHWLDHWSDADDEIRALEMAESCAYTTVGYLVRETDTVLSLAQSIRDDGKLRTVLHVMKALVVRRKTLRKG